MKTGGVAERLLDPDWSSEFPRINENYMGLRNQFSYNGRMPQNAKGALGFDGIIKYDLVNESSQHFEYGPGRYGGEPILPPEKAAPMKTTAGLSVLFGMTKNSVANALYWTLRNLTLDPSRESKCQLECRLGSMPAGSIRIVSSNSANHDLSVSVRFQRPDQRPHLKVWPTDRPKQ